MRQLIAGNWKMNGLLAESATLAEEIRNGAAGLNCDVVVCPPFTALSRVADVLRGSTVQLGAQDCHRDANGAHTGDISAAMLRELGVGAVILGHSERRAEHGEIDEAVREKAVAAAAAGLLAIVCVGESADQRNAGRETEVVGWQIEGSLPKGFSGVIAYEPLWAIGAGRAASAAEVETMHAFIRAELLRQFGPHGETIRILYGGSVKADNAAALLALPDVGGALVGGASLKAAEFLAIARAAHALCNAGPAA